MARIDNFIEFGSNPERGSGVRDTRKRAKAALAHATREGQPWKAERNIKRDLKEDGSLFPTLTENRRRAQQEWDRRRAKPEHGNKVLQIPPTQPPTADDQVGERQAA